MRAFPTKCLAIRSIVFLQAVLLLCRMRMLKLLHLFLLWGVLLTAS